MEGSVAPLVDNIMKIGQLLLFQILVTSSREIVSRKGTYIDHRAIKAPSIGLYFNNEISCQICYILREFCRLGCPCYRYMFRIKTDNVTSNPKYGALLRSAVNSWLASLPMTNCI